MITKILVVDDETDLELLIKQKFRRQIREKEFEFIFSINGFDALEKLKKDNEIDIVLSDINMPEMDGLSLLSHLEEVSPIIKAVIVSAYGDMENIRTAMNKGAFDFVCKPVNFEDLEVTIRKTIKHVLQSKETLEAISENSIMRLYVDESVLKFMGRKEFEDKLMRNETVDVTVAFVDICGFTAITETEKADTVVALLNKYFDLMVEEIIGQNGHLDKFLGDAVMAVFRGEDHLGRAIKTCIAIKKKIDALPKESIEFPFTPKVSIGIHSGEVVSGNIGSATYRRLDYTIIGDVVNTASRLQSIAKAGQIVVAKDTYDAMQSAFSFSEIGEVLLKNKAKPLVIYEVNE